MITEEIPAGIPAGISGSGAGTQNSFGMREQGPERGTWGSSRPSPLPKSIRNRRLSAKTTSWPRFSDASGHGRSWEFSSRPRLFPPLFVCASVNYSPMKPELPLKCVAAGTSGIQIPGASQLPSCLQIIIFLGGNNNLVTEPCAFSWCVLTPRINQNLFWFCTGGIRSRGSKPVLGNPHLGLGFKQLQGLP